MIIKRISKNKTLTAYIVGIALGDGNLSNPGGRAARLRVTCDKRYPKLLKRVENSIKILLPDNKVQIVDRKNCVDVSSYSNHWPKILGWKPGAGSKFKQKVRIPVWIASNKIYSRSCLKGLFETDGCVYIDRGYTMVNFVSEIPSLVNQVVTLIKSFGYRPNLQKLSLKNGKEKCTVRIARNSEKFIREIGIDKR